MPVALQLCLHAGAGPGTLVSCFKWRGCKSIFLSWHSCCQRSIVRLSSVAATENILMGWCWSHGRLASLLCGMWLHACFLCQLLFLQHRHCSRNHSWVKNSQVEQFDNTVHILSNRCWNPEHIDWACMSFTKWSWKKNIGTFSWYLNGVFSILQNFCGCAAVQLCLFCCTVAHLCFD